MSPDRPDPQATPDACAELRDQLSAANVAERAPGAATSEATQAHLRRCGPCSTFAAGLHHLDELTGSALASAPDLTGSIVAAVVQEQADEAQARTSRLRWLTGLAGVVQLALAVPMLLGVVGPDLHAGRDLGALQLAVAVGLLFAAAQPRRAAGVLPVVAAVVATTMVVAVVDVANGVASVGAELVHVSELVGAVALWALARRTSNEVGRSRLVEAW